MARKARPVRTAARPRVVGYTKQYRTIATDTMRRPLFATPKAREMRYLLYEAMWENTAYDGGPYGTHPWAHYFKTKEALYKYTKGLYNPTYRCVEFWATHLFGGELDDQARDGTEHPSALPIVTPKDNDALRKAIAKLWHDSDWEARKTQAARYGAMLGDSPIRVEIDPEAEVVKIAPVNPKHYADVRFDVNGRVVEYLYQEMRRDPDQPMMTDEDPKFVLYTEHARKTPDGVHFKTYLDGAPFNWRGVDQDGAPLPPEWDIAWPMLPLVWIKHIDIGLDTGLGEIHCGLSKFVGLDDVGSKFNDHIRQAVKTRWLFAGITQRELLEAKNARKKASVEDPEPGRDEEWNVCAGKTDAKAHSLTTALDLQGASVTIINHLSEVERDYPELRYDRMRSTVESSAKALREIRKPVITKVNERRKSYDPHLATIQALAVCVGGELGYEGYDGFSLADWNTEKVAHKIGPRPVFEVEPIDRTEEDQAKATDVMTWVQAEVPLVVALKRAGWPEHYIAEVEKLVEEERKREEAQMKAQMDAQIQARKVAANGNGRRAAGRPGKPGAAQAKQAPRAKAPKG